MAPLENVVFRIPRFAPSGASLNKHIKDQFCILEALRPVKIKAPRILAYDCTSDNTLGMPFSLQTRLEGQRLDLVYQDLDLAERLGIASDLVDVLSSLDGVKLQRSGRLCSPEDVPPRKALGDMNDLSLADGPTVQGFGVGIGERTATVAAVSLQESLSTQLGAWLQHEGSDVAKSFVVDMFRRLEEICTEMTELGFFEERKSLASNILYHWDLEPRNIIVGPAPTDRTLDNSEKQALRIAGVLDWDDALSVPPVLACKPPVWLWDFSHNEDLPPNILADYDGDVDLLPLGLYDVKSDRVSDQSLQVRQFFETTFTERLYGDSSLVSRETYHDDAYGRGRWLRRLWRFALDGFSDNMHVERFQNFDEAWSEYRKTQSGV
ncbi:hypothetical protein AUEXF2481DRAFT_78733 [Aureobasidium subglaciale EXF-2481]|uniref:Aminoglycoside phosphotransferase domain-containing protein n=1 Tax=Aureobasidium subglaciale (strain EXF-2481) TaxID=1043005 RepID=A0A074YQD9_AURSE|nr:uncharacterized protein AUEXF2481DRAFT_78733 [Aureobasidium subglaciale EXF-2481]KAI5201270.1 hypothetical protein E4T38_06112 [Aureobasidium subglaciale]KAI5219835.1 hypothetical protein E4T40_06133 [Aureobasidium subglaciale]KAI5223652.1 hypothetical protein E4T41_06064 [Aureobasidium subglaciale]KAI5260545.1 hypothetical protein E4T46_05867 [Aureobasidium subglaciale]KEQ96297.1 hypothetical protein AUEXF2481DRAFT_78733 [Aureobasidium subglaciale EXF-2481]